MVRPNALCIRSCVNKVGGASGEATKRRGRIKGSIGMKSVDVLEMESSRIIGNCCAFLVPRVPFATTNGERWPDYASAAP